MPIKNSAKKSLRRDRKARVHNLLYKNKIKKLEKQILLVLSQKKNEEAKKLIPQYYKIADKAAKEKVIKKNNAGRRKSRFSRLTAKTEKN